MSGLIQKCVAKTKKVTFRKSLKATYINWLRELDLNQRPSGYEGLSHLKTFKKTHFTLFQKLFKKSKKFSNFRNVNLLIISR